MSITAAPVLALLIGAGALLLPELTNFEIPGVIRIERQVQEQARRQEEIIGLIQRINLSQNQNIVIELVDLISRQAEKRQRFESDDS